MTRRDDLHVIDSDLGLSTEGSAYKSDFYADDPRSFGSSAFMHAARLNLRVYALAAWAGHRVKTVLNISIRQQLKNAR